MLYFVLERGQGALRCMFEYEGTGFGVLMGMDVVHSCGNVDTP